MLTLSIWRVCAESADDPLAASIKAGVGCFIGSGFVGALARDDDDGILVTTAAAEMR